MKKITKFIKSPYIIAILFGAKMLLYYYLIKVNRMEIALLIFSMAVWGVIFLCFSRSGLKRKRGIFLLIYFLLSLLMFADTMYFNYYNQTVSVKQIWQAKSVTAVPKSFFATMIPASFLLFVDIPFVYHFFKKDIEQEDKHKWRLKKEIKYTVFALLALMITFVLNPFHSAAIARVNSMEFFTSHVSDLCETIAENISPDQMSDEEIKAVLDSVPKSDQHKYRGIGSGKNLVVIQMEAMQDFVIGATYEGQEITPNMNKLLAQDTIYFDNYYSNIGKGNTADAEFSSLNSIYPNMNGECYRIFEDNTFNGLPWLMKNKGYNTFAIHGYRGGFWNREAAYPNQGFNDFISREDLNQDDTIGMGVSDKSMFKQLIPILKEQTGPFFTFAVTLTNHHPFVLDDKYKTLTLNEKDEGTKLGDYLETVHYTDEAIGQFIDDLKANGLYDNTVIALYGDHHGLSCTQDDIKDRMTEFIGHNYDFDEMFNIPLIIHVPGSGVKETISTTGGQIDFLPTMANIMDLDMTNTFVFGQDLVNAKSGFVAFTSYMLEGSFLSDNDMFQISREGIFEGSRAWTIHTEEKLDESLFKEQYERALLLKKASFQMLDQDYIAKYVTHESK